MLGVLLFTLAGCTVPSNERDWRPEYARAAHAVFSDADHVHIDAIRDFHYRTEKDFDVRYREGDFRISELNRLEYVVVHWNGNKAVGHSMMIFSFKNGSSLVFSVETRKDQKDSDALLAGLFNQYELICIIGTEDDLLKLRTDHRHEDVYLYRTNATGDQMKIIFRDLLERTNKLGENPRFYHTLSQNCMKSLLPSIGKAVKIPERHKKYLLNGFSDELAFELGFLTKKDISETFEQMKKRCYINPLLKDRDAKDDYSKLIRQNEAHP